MGSCIGARLQAVPRGGFIPVDKIPIVCLELSICRIVFSRRIVQHIRLPFRLRALRPGGCYHLWNVSLEMPRTCYMVGPSEEVHTVHESIAALLGTLLMWSQTSARWTKREWFIIHGTPITLLSFCFDNLIA